MPLDARLGLLAVSFSMIMITMFVSIVIMTVVIMTVVIMVIAAADEAKWQCDGD